MLSYVKRDTRSEHALQQRPVHTVLLPAAHRYVSYSGFNVTRFLYWVQQRKQAGGEVT